MDFTELDVTLKDDQERLFMHHWVDAHAYAVTRLQEGRQVLAQLALQRYRDGFDEFGADMFEDSNSDVLSEEIDEELADSISWGIGHQWHLEKERISTAQSVNDR